MPVKRPAANPSLDHLQHQAKDLLRGHAARSPEIAQRIRDFHPRFERATDTEIFDAALKLADAQLAIARQSGFPSWARLKAHLAKPVSPDRLNLPHHERISDPVFRRAVDLLDAGDAAGLRAYLVQNPKLARQRIVFDGGEYFGHPSLLAFIAENPVRHGKLPPNIVETAKVILDAGAERSAIDETLGLVSTGRVPRESGVQVPLIDLLCERGANPDGAILAAAAHGEFEAVDALIARGARITLPIAAALGRADQCRRLLAAADGRERHLALAFAAQFGRVELVRMLLDAGEDPNRYNPVGAHSHATPLHQAAHAGHFEVVRLLVERGARLDVNDLLWRSTAADWAHHAGHTEIEAYLRAQQRAPRATRKK
jgi:hypothetical protein